MVVLAAIPADPLGSVAAGLPANVEILQSVGNDGEGLVQVGNLLFGRDLGIVVVRRCAKLFVIMETACLLLRGSGLIIVFGLIFVRGHAHLVERALAVPFSFVGSCRWRLLFSILWR